MVIHPHNTFIPHVFPQGPQGPQVPVTLANRAAVAAQLHHRTGARIILSGADVSRVGSSEAQVRLGW